MFNSHNIKIGLGWDSKHDMDASLFLFDQNINFIREGIVFYNQIEYPKLASKTERAIFHSGDKKDGKTKGDDEFMTINLKHKELQNVEYIVVCITIKDPENKNDKTFKDVRGAYCRLVFLDKNEKEQSELCKFKLSENKDGKSSGAIPLVLKQTNGYW